MIRQRTYGNTYLFLGSLKLGVPLNLLGGGSVLDILFYYFERSSLFFFHSKHPFLDEVSAFLSQSRGMWCISR